MYLAFPKWASARMPPDRRGRLTASPSSTAAVDGLAHSVLWRDADGRLRVAGRLSRRRLETGRPARVLDGSRANVPGVGERRRSARADSAQRTGRCRFPRPVRPAGRPALLSSVHRRQGVDTIEVFSAGTRKVVMRLEGRARESPQVLNTPVYSPTGHLLYRLEQGNAGIWAVPFSLSRLETTGDPFLVAAGASLPSITANGLLAYAAPCPRDRANSCCSGRTAASTGRSANRASCCASLGSLRMDGCLRPRGAQQRRLDTRTPMAQGRDASLPHRTMKATSPGTRSGTP